MGYYLTRFGNTIFPTIQPVTEMPTAPPQPGNIDTLGMGYDAFGSDIAPATFPYYVRYRVVVTGSASAYMTSLNQLRSMARKRNYLYRTGQDGSVHRALSRLETVSAQDSVETFNAIELSFDFAIWSHWESNWDVSWTLDDGEYFDTGLVFDAGSTPTTLTTSPQTVSITNNGNVAVDDSIITITAGNAAITAVTVACTAQRWTWTWTGTLAIGKSLIIDCGAWSVLNDGADAWVGFAFNSTHAFEGIARIGVGSNSIVVTKTGGGTGSTIGFVFPDRWA